MVSSDSTPSTTCSGQPSWPGLRGEALGLPFPVRNLEMSLNVSALRHTPELERKSQDLRHIGLARLNFGSGCSFVLTVAALS